MFWPLEKKKQCKSIPKSVILIIFITQLQTNWLAILQVVFFVRSCTIAKRYKNVVKVKPITDQTAVKNLGTKKKRGSSSAVFSIFSSFLSSPWQVLKLALFGFKKTLQRIPCYGEPSTPRFETDSGGSNESRPLVEPGRWIPNQFVGKIHKQKNPAESQALVDLRLVGAPG